MIDSLSQLKTAMAEQGVQVCYVKSLSPNDNSKNQIYLGGNFEVLNILPVSSIEVDSTKLAGSKRERTKATIDFAWLNDGFTEPAPKAQLILYPKYPEVRLSSILAGTSGRFSNIIASREEGRTLFLGVTQIGTIIAFVASPDSAVSKEFHALGNLKETGVFKVWPTLGTQTNTRDMLLQAIYQIYEQGFYSGRKLDVNGNMSPYRASNGGGYTLEAALGISPNSLAEPDYLGWEVKQYGTNGNPPYRPLSAFTLFTPEPNTGLYVDKGFTHFIRSFGYADRRGRPNRWNFGGTYRYGGLAHPLTGLRLEIKGFDPCSPGEFSMAGELSLVTPQGDQAAGWTFSKILEHWNRKHSQAAFVSSVRQTINDFPNYRFGPIVQLGEGTDFTRFLLAVSKGIIYLDPALKLVRDESGETTKRRNQFRIRPGNLDQLYFSHVTLNLTDEFR